MPQPHPPPAWQACRPNARHAPALAGPPPLGGDRRPDLHHHLRPHGDGDPPAAGAAGGADRRRDADQRRPGRPGAHAPPADRTPAGRHARRRRRDPDRHPVLHRRAVQPVQLPLSRLPGAGRRRAVARVDLGAGRPVDRLLRRAVLRQRVPEARRIQPAQPPAAHADAHAGHVDRVHGRRLLHRLLHRARPPRAGAGRASAGRRTRARRAPRAPGVAGHAVRRRRARAGDAARHHRRRRQGAGTPGAATSKATRWKTCA